MTDTPVEGGTRRRYTDPLHYQAQLARAKSLQKLGIADADEPPYVEGEVVVIDGPDGPVRVWADKVEDYQKVWAEMEAAKAAESAEAAVTAPETEEG